MKAKDIVALACRMAKGPGMVVMGGQFLNMVLQDLKLHNDLKINRVTQMITVQPGGYGPFPLEADYLRTYDLFYPLPASGGAGGATETQFLAPITMEQFDAEFTGVTISGYPYERATDLSTQAQTWSGGSQGIGSLTSAGQLWIYPQTSGVIVMTHRYMVNQPDIVKPETSIQTPWFEYDEYLIYATAVHVAGITGDDRQETWREKCKEMLRPHLIMEGDDQQTIRKVRLDPRTFKFRQGLRPTKASPL